MSDTDNTKRLNITIGANILSSFGANEDVELIMETIVAI